MTLGITKTRINRDITYDESLFIGYKTKTLLDKLLSSIGGVHKAMNYLVVGDPGVGKTTIILDCLSNIVKVKPDAKVAFVSGEMTVINFHSYIQRYPKFGDIDMIFMSDHIKEFNPDARGVYQMFIDLLKEGYDIIALDSLEVLKLAFKEELKISGNQAEKVIIALCKEHNTAKNDLKLHTAFLLIQHVNKGGTFVGTNALMHLIDASMQIRFDEIFDTDERYIYFDKHRIGTVGDKLYFSLKSMEDVLYNEERFELDQKQKELKIVEKKRLLQSGKEFDKAFGLLTSSERIEERLAEEGSISVDNV